MASAMTSAVIFGFSMTAVMLTSDAYSFTQEGTVDLLSDGGWSKLGEACVAYVDTNNFSANLRHGPAAGTVEITLKVKSTQSTDSAVANQSDSYVLVFYNDQTTSYPMVSNHANLTCQDKISGNYQRILRSVALSAGSSVTQSIAIHEHLQLREWYFYLAHCNVSSILYPNIWYHIQYRDGNDTTTCSNISSTSILMIALIAVIVCVAVGLLLRCLMSYIRKKRESDNKQNGEELLMELPVNDARNEQKERANTLLNDWALQQYSTVLIHEKGYDDVELWKDLTVQDLQHIGFTEGDSEKFVQKVGEYLIQ